MKRKVIGLSLAIYLLFDLTTTASAYNKMDYSLIGGVYNRTYYYSNSIITYNNITVDYAHCQIILNVYYIHERYNTRRNTAAHEFGHALGLLHSDDSFALMWAYLYQVSELRTPTNDDVEGVRDIYS